ncbi:sugar O-acetyltransferase [Microbacterium sp. GXF0217]
MTSNLEKYLAGEPFNFLDPEVAVYKERSARLCAQLNDIDPADLTGRQAIITELFGSHGTNVYMQSPFRCDNGKNITVGEEFLTNYNVSILDVATVTIGDNCLIGPNTVISTVNHPLDIEGRRNKIAIPSPVTIGDDVWIGANCTVLPGVTIGSNVVVAAGAVVTKDVPDDCIVAGVPAKLVRHLT